MVYTTTWPVQKQVKCRKSFRCFGMSRLTTEWFEVLVGTTKALRALRFYLLC